MFRIELNGGLEGIAIVGEVILLLGHVGQKDLETIGQGNSVVGIFFCRLARRNHDQIRLLLVSRFQIAQRRHLHVRAHVHLAIGHGEHGVGAAILVHPLHVRHGHVAHIRGIAGCIVRRGRDRRGGVM